MMTRVVWKYALLYPGVTTVFIPEGAEVLTVGMQGADLVLWALVDPDARQTARDFWVLMTGERVSAAPGRYLGTVTLGRGLREFGIFPDGIVAHVFEEETSGKDATPGSEEVPRDRPVEATQGSR